MERLDDYLRTQWFDHEQRDASAAAEEWLTQALASGQAAELLTGLVRERAAHQFRTFQRVTYERGSGAQDSRDSHDRNGAHTSSDTHGTHGAQTSNDSQASHGAPAQTKVQKWLAEEVWIPGEGMKPWAQVTAADLKLRTEWLGSTIKGLTSSLRFIKALSKALDHYGVDTVGELPESALPKAVR